jgi:hypothetical protein
MGSIDLGDGFAPPVPWGASGQVQPAAPVEAPAGRKLSFLRISDFLNDGARLLIAPGYRFKSRRSRHRLSKSLPDGLQAGDPGRPV